MSGGQSIHLIGNAQGNAEEDQRLMTARKSNKKLYGVFVLILRENSF